MPHLQLIAFASFVPPSTEYKKPRLRFACKEGAQRSCGQRIFGSLQKGRTPRAWRSVAHTCYHIHQQLQLKWRASGGSELERLGPSTSTRRERRSGPDQSAKHTDLASGRRRSGVKTRKATSARGKTVEATGRVRGLAHVQTWAVFRGQIAGKDWRRLDPGGDQWPLHCRAASDSGKCWWSYHYRVVSRQLQGWPRPELQKVCVGMDFPRPYPRLRWSRWVCTALLLMAVTTWPRPGLHADVSSLTLQQLKKLRRGPDPMHAFLQEENFASFSLYKKPSQIIWKIDFCAISSGSLST